MADLRSPQLIFLKGGLFFTGGCLSSALILVELPSWKLAALLCLAVWCFCRAYYFAFYVIQHYVDPAYRFAGLWSFARYVWDQRCTPLNTANETDNTPPD